MVKELRIVYSGFSSYIYLQCYMAQKKFFKINKIPAKNINISVLPFRNNNEIIIKN